MYAVSRRRALQALGLAAGGAALPFVARGSDHAFRHGVASGDPLADRVIIWTRLTPSAGRDGTFDLRWDVARDRDFRRIVRDGRVETGPERDYTVKVDVTGLEPGETWYYRFRHGERVSPVGRTRTLPRDGAQSVKLAVVSCSNYPQGYFNVYHDIAARDDIHAVLHLGDYFYEYPEGGYANPIALKLLGHNVQPPHETVSLDDYRTRYALYRSEPGLQAVHAAHPMIAVWDDHESANDSWGTGAQNHNEGEGEWDVRKAASIQAWREWLPVRDAGDGDSERIFRHFDFGGLADLMMLDTRLYARDMSVDYGSEQFLRRVAFDVSNPDAPVAITDPERAASMPESALRHIPVPFDMTGESPQPVLDYQRLQQLDPDNLPEGLSYLPDPERFRDEVLGNPDREMLGQSQLQWLTGRLKASKAPWQVLGQQVLMGELRAPDLLDVASFDDGGFLTRERAEQLTRLSEIGLPLNPDSWDGYPAARERLFATLRDHATTAISLAGDTHNAWAFNLTDDAGRAVGVECATSSVSSPGMESYIPAPPGIVAERFVRHNPELVYLDSARRGWMELDLGPGRAVSRWHFVTTVLSQMYQTLHGPALAIDAGEPVLKRV